MKLKLSAALNQQTAWLDNSRQSSAAKGNMGAPPPINMSLGKPVPDD